MKLILCILLCALATSARAQSKWQVSLIQMNESVKADSSMMATIAPYRDTIDTQLNQIIGYASCNLATSYPESPLTNFVADGLMCQLSLASDSLHQFPHPDVALVNLGGLRAPIPMGDISVYSVFQVMPFENVVVLVQIVGSDLLKIFERTAARGGDGISGATLRISNHRLLEAKVGENAIDANKQYTVVTCDYLAQGGDGYSVFTKYKPINTNQLMRNVMITHIKMFTSKGQYVFAQNDGRIVNEN